MGFRARVVGVRKGVEGQRIDRVSEPAATVNVTTHEIVSSIGVGNIRRVVPLKDGQAKSGGGNQGGRRGIPERARIVDDVSKGAVGCLQTKVSKSGGDRRMMFT